MSKRIWLAWLCCILLLSVRLAPAADRELKIMLATAEKAEQKNDLPAAIENYLKVLEKNYYPGRIHLILGRLYLAAGNKSEAEKHLTQALEQELNQEEQLSVQALLGTISYCRQNYAQAIERFNNCIEMKRNYESAYLGLAKVYIDMQMYPEALKKLNVIRRSKKLKFEYNLTAGLLYRDWGLYQKALLSLRQAIVSDPTSTAAHQALADIYYQQKEYGQALRELSYVASLQPQGSVYRTMALCLFYLREKEKAMAFLLKAIKLEPNDHLNYAIGGLIYYESHDWEKAGDQFTRSLEMNSQSALALIGRGWCEKKLNDTSLAMADFQKVLDLRDVSWLQELAQKNIAAVAVEKR
ncbi:MAG: tetratricopeptide repeat protein [Elusimicrobia bacterium]|nr:tetratricopeptide repeat protein [Elusimicrobiota bacterium]